MEPDDPQASQRRRITFLIVLSFVGFAYGAYRLWDALAFGAVASRTQGQVVAREGSSFTIEFSVDGQVFHITEDLPGTKGMTGMERARLQPGASVVVLYDPSSPSHARWDAKRNWFFPLAVMAVSMLAGLAGWRPDLAGRTFRRG